MADQESIRRKRDGAIALQLGIDPGDRIVAGISRRDGLHSVTLDKIIRVNLPDDLDPQMRYEDAPITQTLVVNKGSRSPIVARTILQTRDICRYVGDKSKEEKLQDIAWELMFSLLALERIVADLRETIEVKTGEISEKHPLYAAGKSPPPPPIVEDLETQFRSAVIIGNHAVNSISEIFPVLFEGKFKRGSYDRLILWSNRTFGMNDPLTLMLTADHRWISTWREVRNAFEHPKPDYFVKVNNFRLLADRTIQLPTWQLKHSKLDLFRPQNMVDHLAFYQSNLLGFFENLVVELVAKASTFPFQLALLDKEEKDRDPDCPTRYEVRAILPSRDKNSG